jgi:hypothetical protein
MNTTIQDMYQSVWESMIEEAGGELGDVIWTSRDGTKAKFRDLPLTSIRAMHRYFRIQEQAMQVQKSDLDVQINLQKLQKSKKQTGEVPGPGGINVGKFKKPRKALDDLLQNLGFTVYVLEKVLRFREQQDLTVSPMLAKMRATATGRFKRVST